MMKGVTLNILVLGLTSLLTDVSSEMVFALLPFFMVYVLNIEIMFVGFVEGSAEAAASFLKTLSGWLSDKVGRRKPFAVLGYSMSALLRPLFSIATSPIHIFIIRVADRVGKGIRTPPRDALIADSVKEDVRGKAYGFHRSMDTLGAVIGPLIAFLLFPALWYRNIFLASLIPGLAAVILLTAFVKEKPWIGMKDRRIQIESKPFSLGFKVFVAIATTFTLSNFSYAFFLLRAKDLGIAIGYVPLLYLLFNLVYATFAFPIGVMADRVGKKLMVSLGYLTFGLTCLGFAFASSPTQAVALFIAYGLSFATVDAVQRAMVPDLVTARQRGAAFGVLHAAIGLASLPSSFIAGALWQLYGASIPFITGAVVSITSAMLLLMLTPAEHGS